MLYKDLKPVAKRGGSPAPARPRAGGPLVQEDFPPGRGVAPLEGFAKGVGEEPVPLPFKMSCCEQEQISGSPSWLSLFLGKFGTELLAC